MNINVNEYKLPMDKAGSYGSTVGSEELSGLHKNAVRLAN